MSSHPLRKHTSVAFRLYDIQVNKGSEKTAHRLSTVTNLKLHLDDW